MNSILNIGRTGLNSVQRKMDQISDDIANSNTYGYKRKEISFKELLTNEIHEEDVNLSENVGNARINMGVNSGVSRVNFSQGSLISSSREWDLAIEGEGFFGLLDNEGTLSLTRNGSFHMDGNKNIVNSDGYYLNIDFYDIDLDMEEENIEFEKYTITPNGNIVGHIGDEAVEVGSIILYRPEVLDSLIPMGEGRYLPNEDLALYNSSVDDGFGDIVQYTLEGSNTDMAKSLTDMIVSQRAYSLNLKAVQTTDEIMNVINNIK